MTCSTDPTLQACRRLRSTPLCGDLSSSSVDYSSDFYFPVIPSCLVTGTFIAAITGNDIAYRTGRRYGRSWIQNREEGRAKQGLKKAEEFYEKRGWWSVVIARWLSWVRTFVPVIAGTAAMDRRAFTSANVVGALPWAIGLPYLGALAYTVPWLRTIATVIAVGSIVAALIGGLYAAVMSWRRRSSHDSGEPPSPDAMNHPSGD